MTTSNRAIIWCAVSSASQASEDKISLDMQEQAAREFCQQQGYEIIDVLKVDGHTRSDPDLDRLIQLHLKRGNNSYQRLRDHWRAADFQILVAYDDSRISRGAYEQIVKSIIYSGASIYRIVGGWITDDNIEFQAALGGIKANAGMKEWVRKRKVAMSARAKRGLFTGYKPAMSHLPVYDPQTGELTGMVLDESKAALWQHVFQLLMENISWTKMEKELYRRWGHTNANTGGRYSRLSMQKTVYNPNFWGHTGRYYYPQNVGQSWVHEDDLPPPAGIELTRHTIPAVWTGEQAKAAREKLLLKESQERGSRAYPRHAFAGLLICGSCRYTLNSKTQQRQVKRNKTVVYYTYWRCPARDQYVIQAEPCVQPPISDAAVQKYVDTLLRRIDEVGNLTLLLPSVPSGQIDERRDLSLRLAALEQEYQDTIALQRMARALPEKARHQETLDTLVEQIEIVRLALAKQTPVHPDPDAAQNALDTLRHMTIDAFWQLESAAQNQILRTLLGNVRLVVQEGAIIGLAYYRRKPTGKRKQ